MLVRAVGPTLAQFGVGGALQKPALTAYDSTGKVIGRGIPMKMLNAYEQYLLDVATVLSGAFALPLDTEDVVMLLLIKGTTTFHVTGTDGAKGEVLVEGYWVPKTQIDRPTEILTPAE